jgi:probable phosphoglycerate mutase
MTTCYFVRHGITEINVAKKVNGGLVNSKLTADGTAGARAAGEALKNVAFDAVYSSPQRRAIATAELVLQPNVHQQRTRQAIRLNEALREMSLGDWEGHLISDFAQHEQFDKFTMAPDQFDPSEFHGETYAQLAARGVHFMQRVTYENPTGTILIVGHGTMLTVLTRTLLGVPLSDIMKDGLLSNASVTVLETPDGQHYDCKRWNDTSFMKGQYDGSQFKSNEFF